MTAAVGHHRVVPLPDRSTTRAESAFDWCFRNRETNQITIAQVPNVALGVFVTTVVLGLVIPEGTTAHQVVAWIGVAAIGWWSTDELVRGVNPWRRLLGIGGLAVTVAALVRLLSG